MKKTITVLATALIGLSSSIALSTLWVAPAFTGEPSPEIPTYQEAKEVPISVYQVKIAIPAGTTIGKATQGWLNIVTQEWHIEELNNTAAFVERIYKALQKSGYTAAVPPEAEKTPENTSVFQNINAPADAPTAPTARFLVGATITKTWMSVANNGWGGWATDVDMKVNWEVYDTLQNKIVLTRETYAIDRGGGLTTAYYYTVMEKAAEKFFTSPEFKAAIETALADTPAPDRPEPPNPR
ncbi:hypothetical protein V0288_10635 [Pannus brasiliensis CCIBt3594]|uniref:Uncharacterized protein n=1 Tax=Pannus brasiliensis CCIBt3594 TaxID=1427578 RepID=A0AAW9QQT7_9CHRO